MSINSKITALLYFTEAIIFLYYYKLVLSIQKVQKVLYSVKSHANHTNLDIPTLKRIRVAVRRADRFALWQNRCIVKSLAARKMIERRQGTSELYLGVMKDQSTSKKALKAHAWLISQDIEVTPKGRNHYPATTKIQN